MLNQPVTTDALGDLITIRRGPTTNGALGQWDETTGTITLAPDQHPVGELIILVHEMLHAVETMLLQNGAIAARVDHEFIGAGAFGLATLLIHSGVCSAITPEQWLDFQEQAPR